MSYSRALGVSIRSLQSVVTVSPTIVHRGIAKGRTFDHITEGQKAGQAFLKESLRYLFPKRLQEGEREKFLQNNPGLVRTVGVKLRVIQECGHELAELNQKLSALREQKLPKEQLKPLLALIQVTEMTIEGEKKEIEALIATEISAAQIEQQIGSLELDPYLVRLEDLKVEESLITSKLNTFKQMKKVPLEEEGVRPSIMRESQIGLLQNRLEGIHQQKLAILQYFIEKVTADQKGSKLDLKEYLQQSGIAPCFEEMLKKNGSQGTAKENKETVKKYGATAFMGAFALLAKYGNAMAIAVAAGVGTITINELYKMAKEAYNKEDVAAHQTVETEIAHKRRAMDHIEQKAKDLLEKAKISDYHSKELEAEAAKLRAEIGTAVTDFNKELHTFEKTDLKNVNSTNRSEMLSKLHLVDKYSEKITKLSEAFIPIYKKHNSLHLIRLSEDRIIEKISIIKELIGRKTTPKNVASLFERYFQFQQSDLNPNKKYAQLSEFELEFEQAKHDLQLSGLKSSPTGWFPH